MGRFALFLPLPLLLSLLGGCKDEVQCEKARMDLNKSWSELRQAATRRKLDGVDTPAWTDVENKTETLESSFVTRQVTWDSAAKASQAIATELPELHADHEALAASFRTSAESAMKQQSDFERQCR
ncbi:MAG TPA: hypothetical protein VNW92_31935 [Polyangiaceae bacterium]|jgi:hypothetical protein|nr:hypothetical protein [Polyangiaceae bacterium]